MTALKREMAPSKEFESGYLCLAGFVCERAFRSALRRSGRFFGKGLVDGGEGAPGVFFEAGAPVGEVGDAEGGAGGGEFAGG